MKRPRLSVAMSVYNGAPYLAEAIESVLDQTFTDFEFLILDDGSRDDSGDIAARYAARDARIRVIHQGNRGLVASLNRLLGEADAELIARMDADDISLPDRFARQLAFLDSHPEYGVVGTCTNIIDEAGRVTVNPETHPTSHDALLEALEFGPRLCHSSVMMRRDVVLAVGGYRPAFIHCEDFDLWLRLSARTKLCSLPDRLVHYRYSDNQVSRRHEVAQHTGGAIAWLAHLERMAGRADPSEQWTTLPDLDTLDAAFGRAGVTRAVRARVAERIQWSPIALRTDGYDVLVQAVRDGSSTQGMWRTACRLLRLGEPRRAAGLASVLLRK